MDHILPLQRKNNENLKITKELQVHQERKYCYGDFATFLVPKTNSGHPWFRKKGRPDSASDRKRSKSNAEEEIRRRIKSDSGLPEKTQRPNLTREELPRKFSHDSQKRRREPIKIEPEEVKYHLNWNPSLIYTTILQTVFSSRKSSSRPRPGQVRHQWTHPKYWQIIMIPNLKHLKLEEINLLEIKWKKNRRKSRKRPKIKKLWEQSTEQLLATCLPVSFSTQTPRSSRNQGSTDRNIRMGPRYEG